MQKSINQFWALKTVCTTISLQKHYFLKKHVKLYKIFHFGIYLVII